jgi:hypothetical protein
MSIAVRRVLRTRPEDRFLYMLSLEAWMVEPNLLVTVWVSCRVLRRIRPTAQVKVEKMDLVNGRKSPHLQAECHLSGIRLSVRRQMKEV